MALDANYCSVHDTPFFEKECPDCVREHNNQVDEEVAGLAVDLIKIIKFDGHNKLLPAEAQEKIAEIENLQAKYKDGE